MTIFGEVTVQRKGYGASGVGMVFPMDAELNLPRDKYSHGLRRRVAEEAAAHSFEETVADIERTTGGKVPKRQTEEVTVRAAQDFEAFYSGRGTQGPEQTSDILVMTIDQKGVVMRTEDLRPTTRKAAEKSASQPGARLSPGENIDGGEKMARNWRSENPRWQSDDKGIRRRACMRAKKGEETDSVDNGKVGFSPCL